MRAERVYVVSILLGLAVAGLVGWQLLSSRDTVCFRRSVDVPIASTTNLAKTKLVNRCHSKAFKTVVSYIRKQRTFKTPKETDRVKARSALIVWIAFVAATAGFAAFVGVQSVAIIRELKLQWNAGLIALSAGPAILLALPFILFTSTLSKYPLGQFDRLHRAQLLWITPVVGLLALPALIGLVLIWRVVNSRGDLRLDDVSYLGSRMHQLVSMLGAVLALSVLATAARWQAIGNLPGGESAPTTVILLWGSFYALVLGVVYVPVYQRWAGETGRLISEEVRRQLPDDQSTPGTVGFRAAELSLAKELSATLGLGGALSSLQGSVAVLLPIIAAAVSSLFS